MTTQQTDIEKTLKRILARELKEWPESVEFLHQWKDGEVTGANVSCGYKTLSIDREFVAVRRAEWEAERALLVSEQAQPLGDSEEFDQALWDKVAVASFASHLPKCYSVRENMSEAREIALEYCFFDADAFMTERAKRIAARKASHD